MKLTKIVLTTLILSLLIVPVCFADVSSTGWQGFGMYDLNHSKVVISDEKTVIEINRNAVKQTSDYILKNETEQDIEAQIGIPDDNITKLQVYDNGVKKLTKGRSQKYLLGQLGDGSSLPEVNYYYVFNVQLKQGETKSLQVITEATLLKDSHGVYTFTYPADPNGVNTIKRSLAKMQYNFMGYKPYDIMNLDGININQFGADGSVALEYSNGDVKMLTVKYQSLDRLMLDPLQESAFKTPKAIASAFISQDYAKAESLCNNYMERSTDKKLALEQVMLIKAECLRNQNRYDEYLNLINTMDQTKLYPENIKYKLQFDQINTFKIQSKQDEQNKTAQMLLEDSKANRPYLYEWMNTNGFGIAESPTAAPEEKKVDKKPTAGGISKFFAGFGPNINKWVKAIKLTYVIVFVAGLLVGFLLGRNSRSRRRSMYSFRR